MFYFLELFNEKKENNDLQVKKTACCPYAKAKTSAEGESDETQSCNQDRSSRLSLMLVSLILSSGESSKSQALFQDSAE